MNQIEIFQTKDKQTQVEVKFEDETVWLTQQQMAELFKQTKQNVSLHIANCFREKELDRKSVVKDSLTTARDGKMYKTKNYNLDVIISVGYRVKSKRGTQFRQWATQRLKDHLVKGYTLNEKRLHQVAESMQQLEQAVKLIKQSCNSDGLSTIEAKGLLDIITNYTQSFILLNQFDSNRLPELKLNENITYEIKFDEAIVAIEELKKQLIKRRKLLRYSATGETKVLKVYLIQLYKHLAAITCIKVLKNRQHTCCTSLLKTTLLQMAINA